MSKLNLFQRIASVCIIVLFTGIPPVATAAGLADSFRDFVLGSEAHASAAPVRFPSDSASGACMQCHDGSRAGRVHLKAAGGGVQYRGQMIVGHPVGMEYRRFASRNPGVFVRPEKLDKRVVLENGDVTCLSCHRARPRASSPQTTASLGPDRGACTADTGYTTGTTQTSLCMACHAM